MSVTASPARDTARSAASTKDPPLGSRRSSEVWLKKIRRGCPTPHSMPPTSTDGRQAISRAEPGQLTGRRRRDPDRRAIPHPQLIGALDPDARLVTVWEVSEGPARRAALGVYRAGELTIPCAPRPARRRRAVISMSLNVVVVGAGVIGAAIAAALARGGCQSPYWRRVNPQRGPRKPP